MTTTLVRAGAALSEAAVAAWIREKPGSWLPAPARAHGPNEWRVTLHAGPMRRDAYVGVGAAVGAGNGTWRAVRWEAADTPSTAFATEAALPVFVGELGVVPDGDGGSRLVLEGDYEPPGGRVGRVLDVAGMHRVADATGRWLVHQVAQRLEELAAR